MQHTKMTGLVLSGGGARAAYQVGVLRGVEEILREVGWDAKQNPYQIICGTSAGALNATALACHADDFGAGLAKLNAVWDNICVEDVYRADSLGIARSGARWLSLLSFGWLLSKWRSNPPNSLLDNTPLVNLLNRMLDFPRMEAALASDCLRALAVTASSYSSGRHLTFYQSEHGIEQWQRSQRVSVHTQIGIEHLLASSAIPLVFPATPIYCDNRVEYFGDGSMRQLSPISPAIHLGSDRIFVIGAGRMTEGERDLGDEKAKYPSLAQISGHAMSSIFLDSLAVDIERMKRVNQTLSVMTPEQRNAIKLRHIDLLIIAPSERIDSIAARHVESLPRTIKMLLSTLGATSSSGSALASYLLFESSFTRELIELGRRDAQERRDDVLAFFGNPQDEMQAEMKGRLQVS